MTDAEKIEKAKRLMNYEGASDDLVTDLLEQAASAIANRMFPFSNQPKDFEVPSRYVRTQLEIAAYLYGKMGAEGQLIHTENGISRTYEAGSVPESMLKQIAPRCGGVGL